MIYEIAKLFVKAGCEAEFEAAVSQAVPLFQAATGCQSMQLKRVIESPCEYQLLVTWNQLEDHTVGFRESDNFLRWRELVSPFFDAPPEVVHAEVVLDGF